MAANQIVKYENVSDQVLAKIKSFQEVGLQLPANYAVDNAMKAAWLVLQETHFLTWCFKDCQSTRSRATS